MGGGWEEAAGHAIPLRWLVYGPTTNAHQTLSSSCTMAKQFGCGDLMRLGGGLCGIRDPAAPTRISVYQQDSGNGRGQGSARRAGHDLQLPNPTLLQRVVRRRVGPDGPKPLPPPQQRQTGANTLRYHHCLAKVLWCSG